MYHCSVFIKAAKRFHHRESLQILLTRYFSAILPPVSFLGILFYTQFNNLPDLIALYFLNIS